VIEGPGVGIVGLDGGEARAEAPVEGVPEVGLAYFFVGLGDLVGDA